MTKAEYDSLQSALDAHLAKALYHYHLSRAEKTVYENAVHACKSVLSRNAVKDWRKGERRCENS